MAKATIGVGGAVQDVKEIHIGVNGAWKQVKEGYIGVGGAWKRFYAAGPPIGALPVGSTVKLRVGGVWTDFLIVHQGLPSAVYDASCDGAWLLMKDCYEQRAWHSTLDNHYPSSDIHAYLSGDFLALFDAGVQGVIRRAKIPYFPGRAHNPTYQGMQSGENGLPCTVFLLGMYELGWTKEMASDYIEEDGACLSYFKGLKEVDRFRIGYKDGAAVTWWLRSPYAPNYWSDQAWSVYGETGQRAAWRTNNSYYVRPALILPKEQTVVERDGTYML